MASLLATQRQDGFWEFNAEPIDCKIIFGHLITKVSQTTKLSLFQPYFHDPIFSSGHYESNNSISWPLCQRRRCCRGKKDNRSTSRRESALYFPGGLPDLGLEATQWHAQRYGLPQPAFTSGIKGPHQATTAQMHSPQSACEQEKTRPGNRRLQELDKCFRVKAEYILVCTDVSWLWEKIIQAYKLRWTIECFFRMAKQRYGLQSFHTRYFKKIVCHVAFSFLSYLLPAILKICDPLLRELTLGQIIDRYLNCLVILKRQGRRLFVYLDQSFVAQFGLPFDTS